MLAVFILAFAVKPRLRWIVLLMASLVFYASLQAYHLLLALAIVTVGSYASARWMARADPKHQSWILTFGILVNLMILLGSRLLGDGVHLVFVNLNLPPVNPPLVFITTGVSFFVFQGISYLVDVYLGRVEPENHLGYFSLYMAFFAKILLGPIERAENLLPQLRNVQPFNYEHARAGLLLFACGLFKKMVIADRLALAVNFYYDKVTTFQGWELIFATYLFAFQIFFDFSGYSDMALGIARIFNLQLTQNFNHPYFAPTVTEFWRRWHISFSSWLQDYIFQPLQIQFRQWKMWGILAALFVTFFVSGVWHGIRWGYLIWGGLFAVYLSAEILYRPIRQKWYRWTGLDRSIFARVWQPFLTLNLVSLAWIFFRANSIEDAWYVVTHLFDFTKNFQWPQGVGLDGVDAVIIVSGMILYAVAAAYEKRIKIFQQPAMDRWLVYYILAGAIVFSIIRSAITGVVIQDSNFVYFKF